MRECEIRAKAIQSALDSGNFAINTDGSNTGFIWDWQQDNYIEVTSGENVEQFRGIPHCCVFHVEDFITNDSDAVLQDGYIIEIESLHIYKNQVLSIVCTDGVILSHRAWRNIDWEKCGF